jgi:hypothetical protein
MPIEPITNGDRVSGDPIRIATPGIVDPAHAPNGVGQHIWLISLF